MTYPQDLQPGDILGYAPTDWLGNIEEVKYGDWDNPVAHIELYAGNGMSWASRETGINLYPFRAENLCFVKRPGKPFNVAKATKFFAMLIGLPYGMGDNTMDAVGLADSKPGLNCSHTAAVMLQAGDADVFDQKFPKQEICPRDFKLTPGGVMLLP